MINPELSLRIPKSTHEEFGLRFATWFIVALSQTIVPWRVEAYIYRRVGVYASATSRMGSSHTTKTAARDCAQKATTFVTPRHDDVGHACVLSCVRRARKLHPPLPQGSQRL
jgi:hypothetical protein